MNHIHTKKENADKIAALISLAQTLSTRPQYGMEYLRVRIDSVRDLAREAEQALTELKEQTGIE